MSLPLRGVEGERGEGKGRRFQTQELALQTNVLEKFTIFAVKERRSNKVRMKSRRVECLGL